MKHLKYIKNQLYALLRMFKEHDDCVQRQEQPPTFSLQVEMVKENPKFELHDGRIFGEKALDNDKPRAATVFVKSKTMLACTLIKADYVRVMGASFKQNEDMQVSLLKQFTCLAKITENAIKNLYKTFKEINCGKDFVVSNQGLPADGVYFLIDGEVEIYVKEKRSEFDFCQSRGVRHAILKGPEILGLEEVFTKNKLR